MDSTERGFVGAEWTVWVKYRTVGWRPVLNVRCLAGSGERSSLEWLRRFTRAYDQMASREGWYGAGETRFKLRPRKIKEGDPR